MSTYAAFLRGMNVGGHRLTNEELRAHFAAIGFSAVSSFRASGNIVFSAQSQSPRRLAALIERRLQSALGYEVPTFIRAAGELRAMAAAQPFSSEQLRACAGKLQVGLLSVAPAPRAREAALELAGESDRLAFDERALYWLPRAGVLDSALDMKTIERLFGTMTMRTKGTIEQLAARHFA